VELRVGPKLIYTWRDVALGPQGMILSLGRDPCVDLVAVLARAHGFEDARLEIHFYPEISTVEELIEASRTP